MNTDDLPPEELARRQAQSERDRRAVKTRANQRANQRHREHKRRGLGLEGPMPPGNDPGDESDVFDATRSFVVPSKILSQCPRCARINNQGMSGRTDLRFADFDAYMRERMGRPARGYMERSHHMPDRQLYRPGRNEPYNRDFCTDCFPVVFARDLARIAALREATRSSEPEPATEGVATGTDASEPELGRTKSGHPRTRKPAAKAKGTE